MDMIEIEVVIEILMVIILSLKREYEMYMRIGILINLKNIQKLDPETI